MWDLDDPKTKMQNTNLLQPDGFPGKLKWSEVPFEPWARALSAFRMPDMNEPYTRPWSGGFMMGLNSGQESFELICQDNNRTPEINNIDKNRLVP